MLKTVFVGNQQRAVYLRKNLIIESFMQVVCTCYLGKVFGGSRFPLNCLFVCFILNLIIIIIFTWTTTFKENFDFQQIRVEEILSLWNGVACVRKMGNHWTACFYNGLWTESYGFLLCFFGLQWFVLRRVVDILACSKG